MRSLTSIKFSLGISSASILTRSDGTAAPGAFIRARDEWKNLRHAGQREEAEVGGAKQRLNM